MATAFSDTVSPTHSVPSVVAPAAEAEPPPAADEGVETERGSHDILDRFCTLAGYAGKHVNHGRLLLVGDKLASHGKREGSNACENVFSLLLQMVQYKGSQR